ncbi:MAG: transmembrane HD family protein, partial [Marinilabiliales bacterium]
MLYARILNKFSFRYYNNMDEKQARGTKPIKNFLIVILFIISAALIVYVFPKEKKFRYEFQKGKPWMHEIIIAPYDFPIYKSDSDLQHEKDSIAKEAQSYFNFDEKVYVEQFGKFENNFNKKWAKQVQERIEESRKGFVGKLRKSLRHEDFDELKTQYKSFATDILAFIYKKGLVNNNKLYEKLRDENSSIIVVRNNLAKEIDINEIFTTEKATEYITGKLIEATKDSSSIAELEINLYDDLNLDDYLKPNLIYDKEATERVRDLLLAEISYTRGMVQEGEKIISRGEVVDGETYRVLESYKKEYESRLNSASDFYLILVGQIILVSACLIVLFLFLWNFRIDTLHNMRKMIFILLMIVLFVFVGSVVARIGVLSIYLVPFAILPIVIKTFYDARLALFVNLITVLLLGFLVPNAFEFVFMQTIAGIVGIFSLASIQRRGKLFLSVFLVFIAYSFVYFGIGVIQEADLNNIEWINFAWFAGNGLLLLIAYPLIYAFERIFGFLSDVTLMELSDTNHPLMRKLNEKAPGTFQHSLQVGNLAEEAIYQIGGNPLLARVGAMYHDIGKMEIPQYFVENQSPNHNPHDKHSFEDSANIIINH